MKILYSQWRHQACPLEWKGTSFQQENKHETWDAANGLPLKIRNAEIK